MLAQDFLNYQPEVDNLYMHEISLTVDTHSAGLFLHRTSACSCTGLLKPSIEIDSSYRNSLLRLQPNFGLNDGASLDPASRNTQSSARFCSGKEDENVAPAYDIRAACRGRFQERSCDWSHHSMQACDIEEDGLFDFDLHIDGNGSRHLNAGIKHIETNFALDYADSALGFSPTYTRVYFHRSK
ncbi:hypothetical protein E3N88_28530 [Mikania micrantha]|uniref:Uncharacterized protein n=1 Tax=Mikania micrantha TaxID=192012 RepID=A0A5N6MZQ8_9ASTR|nr:hypothetical protein E3N88_28530 [Mikania micrantha]